MKNLKIPEKILVVLKELESAGFEAFLVGGSVRDLLRGVEPKDWDITTKAKPEEILKVFPDGKYENDFGTVILPIKYVIGSRFTVHGSRSKVEQKERGLVSRLKDGARLSVSGSQNNKQRDEDENKKEYIKENGREPATDNCEPNIEITTYRIESTYSDNRRPDEVRFAETLEEDLGRRDFTCNAIAIQINFQFSIYNFHSILNDLILNF